MDGLLVALPEGLLLVGRCCAVGCVEPSRTIGLVRRLRPSVALPKWCLLA